MDNVIDEAINKTSDVIDNLIEKIPQLIEYFAPGYLCILFYRTIRNKKSDKEVSETIHIAESVCISFVLGLVTSFFFGNKIDIWLRLAFEVAVGCIVSLFLACIVEWRLIKKIHSRLSSRPLTVSLFDSVALDKIENEETVFMEDGSLVYGRVISWGDSSEDPWIALDNYWTEGPMFDIVDNDQIKKKDRFASQAYKYEDGNQHIILIREDKIKAIGMHPYTGETVIEKNIFKRIKKWAKDKKMKLIGKRKKDIAAEKEEKLKLSTKGVTEIE